MGAKREIIQSGILGKSTASKQMVSDKDYGRQKAEYGICYTRGSSGE
jgi:hypothetical protein